MEGIGPGEGVRGQATGDGGAGVTGHASSTSGTGAGVHGKSDSAGGTGVKGEGGAAGVHGVATETGGTGMKGLGGAEGVHGEATEPGGTGVKGRGGAEGVRGEATETNGTARGVYGITGSIIGEGVRGEATIAGGIGVVGQAATEGVRGKATAIGGPAIGVRGITASLEGAGVMGCAAGDTCQVPPLPLLFGSGVLGYAPPSPPGGSAASGVAGWSESGSGSGVMGSGRMIGVSGKPHGSTVGESAIGVYGAVDEFNGPASYGVHGAAQCNDQNSAGVLAEGNGAAGPGQPRAAALRIENGAITVNEMTAVHPTSPAGTIPIMGTWDIVVSCNNAPPPSQIHTHQIGYYLDVDLQNDLIVGDSMILVTVEVVTASPEPDVVSYFANVYDKLGAGGHAKIRVTAITKGPQCDPPSETVNRSVHYLIINPVSN